MPENGASEQAQRGLHALNPFAKHDSYSRQALLFHKAWSLITYLLLLITAIYYDVRAPGEGHYNRSTFWGHNFPTPFKQSAIMTSIYWIVLFVLQSVYIYHLFVENAGSVTAAANIGSHSIASNLLLFGFIHLWTRSHFILAEFLLVINFFNLSIAYFRHSTLPRLIHIGSLSGVLAWNFVALYWCGAVMVHAHGLAARVVANVFVWGVAAYGGFFLVAFKDYTMGFALSYLSFSTGVGQFLVKNPVLQLQWIFAFAIGGLLFLLSLAVGMPGLIGREPFKRGAVVDEDRERAPLLADE
ncbi:DUF1774-domain-containing protein [Polyplosphaeria fusca]|uniref:DUF1774-domain-containing protein n=1 Tax=Polyplosphaeria fusca TaxID=682080 RepID=A0A9P4UZ47_9PLEO|nr:DUF1774-domain-containing protein [Polyplosphaeria fusca]